MTFFNPHTLRKYTALLICAFLPLMAFIGVLGIQGLFIPVSKLLMCLVGFIVAALVAFFLSQLLLSNAFRDLLEGQGILTWILDSTGVIRPFIMRLNKPNMEGTIDGKKVSDIFDREGCAVSTSAPIDANIDGGTAEITPLNDGSLYFNINYKLSANQVSNARFQLENFVTFIFNQQTGGFLTKDLLAEKENGLFAQHILLVANRRIEDLLSALRDFGRYIAELTKPKEQGFFTGGRLVMIILIIAFIALAVIFGPKIYAAMGNAYAGSSQVITQTAAANGAIAPVIPG